MDCPCILSGRFANHADRLAGPPQDIAAGPTAILSRRRLAGPAGGLLQFLADVHVEGFADRPQDVQGRQHLVMQFKINQMEVLWFLQVIWKLLIKLKLN